MFVADAAVPSRCRGKSCLGKDAVPVRVKTFHRISLASPADFTPGIRRQLFLEFRSQCAALAPAPLSSGAAGIEMRIIWRCCASVNPGRLFAMPWNVRIIKPALTSRHKRPSPPDPPPECLRGAVALPGCAPRRPGLRRGGANDARRTGIFQRRN